MRGLRSTAVLLVVAIGLGAYIYFVESDQPPGGTPEPRDTVFDFESDDITRLSVTAESGDRTVLEKTDDRWRLVEPFAGTVNVTEVVALSSSLAALEMQRVVAEPEEALELHRKGVGDFLMGEVAGKRPEGFDFGNSPYEISQVDLAGKTLVQSTRAGTVGVAAAVNASEIYLGSFVVAQATAEAVKKDGPELVSIIAMGDEGFNRSDEDEQCGIYLRNIMENRKPDFDAVKSLIMTGGATQKFFDPLQPQYHPEDVTLALEADRYSFAMKISREDGLLVARKQAL